MTASPPTTRTPPAETSRWLLRSASPLRTVIYLGLLLAGFAVTAAFWRYLATGSWAEFHPLAYYRDLATPTGEIFRHPLDVLSYPWMIAVSGSALGLLVFVPLLTSVAYRPLLAAPFVLMVAVLAHAPVLALAAGIGCVVAGRNRLRNDMPFLAMVLGLLPAVGYFALTAPGGVEAAAVQPVQRWALYAPLLLAFVLAVVAGAVLLGLARLSGLRQGAVCPLAALLCVAPTVAFHLRIGHDELAYALIVDRVQTGGAIFEDEALRPWSRRHGAEGLNPQTVAVRVREHLQQRRDRLIDRCDRFLDRHADSDRRPAVCWLRAQTTSLQLDRVALANGLIKYTTSHTLPASAEAWRELREGFPAAPQAALADLHLGELALRRLAREDGEDPNVLVREADEHLQRARAALRKLLPAAADRLGRPEPTRMFAPPPDVPPASMYRTALESVERLLWLMERNDVLTDANSAEALGAYLALNPKAPDYPVRLSRLLSDPEHARERTPMGDNLKLAVALHTPDIYQRAEMLIQLARERTDAAIVANFELGKLALRTAEAPAITLTRGLKTPEEYFRTVIAAPPNPYQQKAADLLASLASRPREG